MFLAVEEAPFVLQGPKPPIPPAAWQTPLALGLAAFVALALAVFVLRRLLRRRSAEPAPQARLEDALRLAESQPDPAAVAQAARAFRDYLAAVEPAAAAALSTEELAAALADRPAFLPARQPLLAALRAADAAKFAGASPAAAPVIADLREAARRIESARRAFGRPAPQPVVTVGAGALGGFIPVPAENPPAATPPPLPPPLPRRDPA